MSKNKDMTWDFNVPLLSAFGDTISSEEKENLDAYFDYDHENGCSNFFAPGGGLDYETIQSPEIGQLSEEFSYHWQAPIQSPAYSYKKDELLECASLAVPVMRRPLTHQNAIDKMSPTDSHAPTFTNPTIPIDVTDDFPVHNTGAIKKRQTGNVAPNPTGKSRRRSLSAEHFAYKPVSRGCGLSSLANKMQNLQLNPEISGSKAQQSKAKKLGRCGSKDSILSSCGSSVSLNQHTTSGQPSHVMTKYVSVAEQVHKFERGTPARFRSVSTKADAKKLLNDLAQEYKKHPLTSTIAESPNLAARNRIRPITAISQEERDEEDLQEIRNYKFRACPVNRNILRKRSAMPVVTRKCNTKPEPFQLTQVKCKPIVPSPEHFVFTAKPVPTKILEEPVGIKERPPPKLTDPMTPKFTYKPRRVPVLLETPGKHSEMVVNDGHSGLRSKSTRPRRTVVKPFSFDQRYLQTVQQKESLVKQHLEELKSAREFHAHPCPIFKTPAKISVPAKITEAVTPNFSSKEIAERKERLFKTKVQEEMRAQQEATNFKARPPVVLFKEPFRPAKSEHPSTEIEEFHMHSEVRAKQREEFESQKKLKEQMREEQLMLLEQKNREIEKAEITRQRKEITHKAQPIRQFKSLEILPSNKPVTVPVTPKIVSRNRK